MKKNLFFAVAVVCCLQFLGSLSAWGQSHYWVMLTDKAGTTFDPYSYFDAKAIERYRLNGADLYDVSNYPLNSGYVNQIDALVSDDFGQSRWLNAVAVTATDEQIAAVSALPFVREVVRLDGEMAVAEKENAAAVVAGGMADATDAVITDQLLRMRGDMFVAKGIDGTGLCIAVFDGGFHAVNTHQAFKHLRDEGRIKATWDFTKKQVDVYDNHTHGTMVLSCIAGKLGDKQLGLATGATFLLAKTEVDPEPFKEEVWWQQAMEWADKNGADIINSSLGYTKDRHYTWQMDGRSYVSKAANMAARKGMLVCNSAGNSGDDKNWKIIGAPADADSILSVGGISPSLTSYRHIGFSSYGPTADGRMKPNVCNYGYAECADPHDDSGTKFAAGTSFSSPLTTGFAACAWQTMRGKKAMEMKAEIEKSCDLYPYYDYAFGYGVPQADYFVGNRQPQGESAFEFDAKGDYVIISALPHTSPQRASRTGVQLRDGDKKSAAAAAERPFMFKIQDREGHIERYVNLGGEELGGSYSVAIPKASLVGYTLVAHVDGTTKEYHMPQLDSIKYSAEEKEFGYYVIDSGGFIKEDYSEYGNRTLADNEVSNWGVGQRHLGEMHFQLGALWTAGDDLIKAGLSARMGVRYIISFKKWYGLGVGLDAGVQSHYYQQDDLNVWDASLGLPVNFNVEHKSFDLSCVNLELFQRIRIKSGGSVRKKGLHWDLGVYGGLQFNNYVVQYNSDQNANCASQTESYFDVRPAADSHVQWGLTTRVVWDWVGLYARLRMSQTELALPRLELGVQVAL